MAPPQEGTLHEPLLATSSTPNDTLTADAAENDSKNFTLSLSYLTCGCATPTTITLNHNVWLDVITCSTYGLSTSLANGTAFAAYVKKIGRNHNGPLGNIDAAEGLASLCTALPIGYLADKVGRSKVIGAAGILVVVVAMAQIFVMEWIQQEQQASGGTTTTTSSTTTTALWLLGACMACWGMVDGVIVGPASALLADSTPEGQRSIYYTYIFVCETLASCVGPLVSIVMFQTLGDDWDLYHLKCVIYVGLGFSIFNGIILLFYDDTKALDEHEDEEEESETNDETNDPTTRRTITETTTPTATDKQDTAEQGMTVDDGSTSLIARDDEARRQLFQQRQGWIPYILFVSSFIMALGSGMTVKFFPLFFKDDVGMTPSQVQGVYVCVPLALTMLSYLCNHLAEHGGLGRVVTTLIATSLGILCLFSMALLKSYLDVHPMVLVPIFVLQSGLMNATYPIMESMLMDFCPKEERARWSSLVDSVAACGWCGSATLGGYLADQYDYTYTFVITAMLQTMGLLVFALLLPLVPRSEGGGEDEEEEAAARKARRCTTTTMPCGDNNDSEIDLLRDPLLQAKN